MTSKQRLLLQRLQTMVALLERLDLDSSSYKGILIQQSDSLSLRVLETEVVMDLLRDGLVSLGPMLAGLGVAGFIVGFALQDTLGNFAAGSMILIYRPYDVDDFVVRPWVKTEDYWDVYFDLMREVKLRLDREGISIPFPQRDVHLYNEQA